MDSDNYPNKSRRRFVAKLVGAGILANVASMGIMSIDLLTQKSGIGGGNITFIGNEMVAGPAPRGMPLIPLTIENGEIIGRAPKPSEGEQNPTIDIAGIEYGMDWFQYCGLQNYPGIQPQFESDNKLYYTGREWHSDMDGEVMTVDHFEDWEQYQGSAENAEQGLGKPAWGTWRSQGVEQTIPISIIKTDKQSLLDGAQTDQARQWVDEACPEGFICWLNKCTHFCCVPQGFQTSDYGCGESGSVCSANMIYCQCHQSRYDPFQVLSQDFVAYPRPQPDEVL